MVINNLGAYLFLLLKVKNIQFPNSFETLAAISYKNHFEQREQIGPVKKIFVNYHVTAISKFIPSTPHFP